LGLQLDGVCPCGLNDWSFSQLCQHAKVSKETVNLVTPETAVRVFDDVLRYQRRNALQVLLRDSQARSINGANYQRLWSADVVAVLREFDSFTPPQKGFNGATGLYAGEQDMFTFLIDPTGWVEIGDQAFAPGYFCWNSEVGKRTVGLSTFWWQSVCANHIVWDAVDVTEFNRKHCGNVTDSLDTIRQMIEALAAKRDQRRDDFAKVIGKAMATTVGDTEEASALLYRSGYSKHLTKEALELAQEHGRLTLWTVIDALTRLAREEPFAGSRTLADQQASKLLALATS
jgi:hypothetical protein